MKCVVALYIKKGETLMQALFEQFLQQTITFTAIMDPVGVSVVLLGKGYL
jgi:hypothetical protein